MPFRLIDLGTAFSLAELPSTSYMGVDVDSSGFLRRLSAARAGSETTTEGRGPALGRSELAAVVPALPIAANPRKLSG